MSERLKKQTYQRIDANNYFWRTIAGREIDFVEEREGKFHGYEFKWGDKSAKAPKEWFEQYPTAAFSTVSRKNYLEFIM